MLMRLRIEKPNDDLPFMIEPTVVRRLYAKAPIVEAVIDLRVTLSDRSEGLTNAEKLADSLKPRFPQKQPIDTMLMAAEAKDGRLSMRPMEHEQLGWKLIGVDNDRTLMISKDGFTYSHLPPYTKWETFQSEAHPLWLQYVGACRPIQVNRVAVRYINRLKLPPGEINLSDYLAFYPKVPDAVLAVSGVVMQIQVPQPNFPGTGRAVITLASEASTETKFQPMVLDFDVSTDVTMSPQASDVWGLLEHLRDTKNELFEACLTDRMKELIK